MREKQGDDDGPGGIFAGTLFIVGEAELEKGGEESGG